MCSHLILSRLSKYPRSCLSMSLCARPCASRSWWNSWWKCRRSFPILRYCSGLWSSTSTFQFLVVVEDQVLVFKVFPLDRVQQRRLPPRNAFLSGLWSRQIVVPVSSGRLHGSLSGQSSSSSHSPAGVEDRADESGKGVFRTFHHNKKMRSWLRTRGRHCSPSRAHPRRLLSWRTPSSG